MSFTSLYPLQPFEVDLKEIFDAKTLPLSAIAHGIRVSIPPYQWEASDGKTRLRFICYPYEKTFANGLAFLVSIVYFLRGLGIRWTITFPPIPFSLNLKSLHPLVHMY